MVGLNLAMKSSRLPHSCSMPSLILPDGGSKSCDAAVGQMLTGHIIRVSEGLQHLTSCSHCIADVAGMQRRQQSP